MSIFKQINVGIIAQIKKVINCFVITHYLETLEISGFKILVSPHLDVQIHSKIIYTYKHMYVLIINKTLNAKYQYSVNISSNISKARFLYKQTAVNFWKNQ